jgi:hypothetical protein
MEVTELFAMGGGWMYIVTAMGIANLVLIAVQFVKIKKLNLSPIIWSCIAALIICGVLGTAVGMTQAGFAVAEGKVIPALSPAEGGAALDVVGLTMSKALAIALTTTEYALLLAFPFSILAGIASYRRKAASPAQ